MLMDLIQKRKSIRDYADKKIPREDILKCIEAAHLAPSACNSQPWKFVVVDDETLKNNLCDTAFTGIYSMNNFAKKAPVLIVVISEKMKFASALAGKFRGTKYCLLDIGMACEHLALQAVELGIGSCMLGWFNEKKVKALLRVPREKKIDLIISLGYEAKGAVRIRARKPLEEISSFNSYSNSNLPGGVLPAQTPYKNMA